MKESPILYCLLKYIIKKKRKKIYKREGQNKTLKKRFPKKTLKKENKK